LRDDDRGVARVHVHYCLSCSRRASRRGREWIDTTHDSRVPIFPAWPCARLYAARIERVKRRIECGITRTDILQGPGMGSTVGGPGPRHATAGVRKGRSRSPERAPDRTGTDPAREPLAAATVTRRQANVCDDPDRSGSRFLVSATLRTSGVPRSACVGSVAFGARAGLRDRRCRLLGRPVPARAASGRARRPGRTGGGLRARSPRRSSSRLRPSVARGERRASPSDIPVADRGGRGWPFGVGEGERGGEARAGSESPVTPARLTYFI